MRVSRIYLARHGQDEDNANGILNGQRDRPLTALGVEQAQMLAKKIQSLELNIHKILSSSLQRAYKTAEIVAETLGLEKPTPLNLLGERDFGVMTGEPVKDITTRCSPNIIISDPIIYFLSPEGAETFPDLLVRAQKILDHIDQNESSEPILLVTHGDIGKMIYCQFYQLDWQDVLKQFHFGNSEVLLLEKDSRPEDRHLHKTIQHNH